MRMVFLRPLRNEAAECLTEGTGGMDNDATTRRTKQETKKEMPVCMCVCVRARVCT